jgi:hypothetical protein
MPLARCRVRDPFRRGARQRWGSVGGARDASWVPDPGVARPAASCRQPGTRRGGQLRLGLAAWVALACETHGERVDFLDYRIACKLGYDVFHLGILVIERKRKVRRVGSNRFVFGLCHLNRFRAFAVAAFAHECRHLWKPNLRLAPSIHSFWSRKRTSLRASCSRQFTLVHAGCGHAS